MKISPVGGDMQGERTVEIRCDEVSFDGLIRLIRKIPGATVTDTAHDPMNDNARALIHYKNAIFALDIPFSDYFITSQPQTEAFDEFISILANRKVRWWERWF
jgi:hypothetical protein